MSLDNVFCRCNVASAVQFFFFKPFFCGSFLARRFALHWTRPSRPRRSAMTSRSRGRHRWYSMPAAMSARAYFSCSGLSLPSAVLSSQKMTPLDGMEVDTRTRSGNPLPSDRQTPGRGDEGDAWKTSHCCIFAILMTWSWNSFSDTGNAFSDTHVAHSDRFVH